MIRHITNKGLVLELVPEFKVETYHDLIDIVATTRYEENIDDIHIAVHKASLHEDFFDLKTRYAGEMLQKLINYGVRMAVIGDFNMYSSKALRDFIREANRTGDFIFVDSLESCLVKWKDVI